ncbi:MAG: glycoside hydrolase family 2 protein [Puniceicoccales bacterium]|jgi:beta-galactosidase|nr:glycoside hydrolase family 2 protein [Puniceicoccales bacterium]
MSSAPSGGGDPFSADVFRVERDNLGEVGLGAGQGVPASSPSGKARPRKVSASDWRPVPGTGLDGAPPPPRFLPWDGSVLLSENWEYLENNHATPARAMEDPGWRPVTLPHSWNVEDTLREHDYRRDASWYRKKLFLTKSDLDNQVFLHFGGIGQSARFWLNGREVGRHDGGYCAFALRVDRSCANAGENTLLVRVTNERNRDLPPLSGDFNQYGGIYRDVRLVRAPASGFCRDKDPVRITSETSARLAKFEVEILAPQDVRNEDPCVVQVLVTAPNGELVFEGSAASPPRGGSSGGGGSLLRLGGEIKEPLLWTPDAPNLYTFTAHLRSAKSGAVLDTVRTRRGFRWFKFTPDDGFFLNGEPFRLRGINRHQDRPGFANALGDAQHDADLRRIKEAGFNFLRLAHYQQDDYVLQRCDELGILVWEEIPLVNVIAPRDFAPSENLARNAEHMLRSMIQQHRDHPSVIIWGIGNEISFSLPDENPGHHAFEKKLLTRLNEVAHELDPSRPTILVSHDSDRPIEAGMMRIPDLVGYNLYKGWYRDTFEALTSRLNALHAANPGKPLLLSEYGAGADPERHSEEPRRYDFSQEYAVDLLANYHDQFDAPPLRWLSGTLLWVLADFGAAHRIESHPFINNKGILDADRRPKDSFYYLKARQQKAVPVVYVQSPAWLSRGGTAAKEYRVFSNMDMVKLTHNGRPVEMRRATPPTPAIFHFPVTLVPGANHLRAVGRNASGQELAHEIVVDYSPKRAPDILPVVPKSVAPAPKRKPGP